MIELSKTEGNEIAPARREKVTSPSGDTLSGRRFGQAGRCILPRRIHANISYSLGQDLEGCANSLYANQSPSSIFLDSPTGNKI